MLTLSLIMAELFGDKEILRRLGNDRPRTYLLAIGADLSSYSLIAALVKLAGYLS